jgi:hypothetical protein
MRPAASGDRDGALRRVWYQFEFPAHIREILDRDGSVVLTGDATGFTIGCGVSGYDEDDALRLVRDALFDSAPPPPIRTSVLDIDVSTLPDQVRHHMGNAASRGVWFPLRHIWAQV